MRESRLYGSVRGVLGNWHSYRDGFDYPLIVADHLDKRPHASNKPPVQTPDRTDAHADDLRPLFDTGFQ